MDILEVDPDCDEERKSQNSYVDVEGIFADTLLDQRRPQTCSAPSGPRTRISPRGRSRLPRSTSLQTSISRNWECSREIRTPTVILFNLFSDQQQVFVQKASSQLGQSQSKMVRSVIKNTVYQRSVIEAFNQAKSTNT